MLEIVTPLPMPETRVAAHELQKGLLKRFRRVWTGGHERYVLMALRAEGRHGFLKRWKTVELAEYGHTMLTNLSSGIKAQRPAWEE